MNITLSDRIKCKIGMHGPVWHGNKPRFPHSIMTDGFERTCEACGAVWHGRQVETMYRRALGGWTRVK